jgi:hypothetical protein
MQRKTTIPGKMSESFGAEQNPWSLMGIVPQGGPNMGLSRAIKRQLSCSNQGLSVKIQFVEDSAPARPCHPRIQLSHNLNGGFCRCPVGLFI